MVHPDNDGHVAFLRFVHPALKNEKIGFGSIYAREREKEKRREYFLRGRVGTRETLL